MNLITSYLLLLLQLAATISATGYSRDDWTGWGGSIFNNRWASTNKYISSSTVKNITVQCQIPHAGGVSATPTLYNGTAYYPTWGGSFVALDYEKCQIRWEINVTTIILNFKTPTPFQTALIQSPYTAGTLSSRTSPQIDKQSNVLFFGTQLYALIVAVDLETGRLLGVTQINNHEAAIVTLSPTLYESILYAGAASMEELAAGAIPGYKCCSFVGNAIALKFDRYSGTFTTVWNLSMLPKYVKYPTGSGWSGVGVWGGQPPIDPGRRHVFFGTGNVYTTPDAFINCTDDTFTPTTGANTTCLPPRVWQNAILAVELTTGTVAWIKRFGPLDVWVLACGTGGVVTDPVSCPGTPGPDYDFGMAPTFVPGKGKNGKDVLTVGQKSGFLYSLAADTGDVNWATATSPGGATGGLSWGVATDDQRVYFTGINSGSKPWNLLPDNTTAVNNSLFGAAALDDGRLLWEVQVKDGYQAYTPPTTVGNLVLVGRVKPLGQLTSGDGPLVVLDKATGKTLLEYPLNGTFRGGVAVHDQYILFGTGYRGQDGFLYVLKASGGPGWQNGWKRGTRLSQERLKDAVGLQG